MQHKVERFSRFSSCRGVAFEIKPHIDPFAITSSPIIDEHINNVPTSKRSYQLPWLTSSKVVPSSVLAERTMSRPSSHFCDLDIEEDDDDVIDIEQGEEEQPKEIESPFRKDLSKVDVKPVPKPKAERLSVILLDQGFFTVYKRLFVVSLALNIIALVLAATGNFSYGRNNATLFSIGNILALTLCRSEAVLRVIFWLAVNLLGWPWVPLRLKTATTALLQSLGGVHSGCGVSSIVWLVYASVLTLNDRANTSTEIIAIALSILSLLCFSALAAFPLVRHLHHNVFERTHRFTGWSALGLLWAFIVLTIAYDPTKKSYDVIGSRLVKQQEFWLTLAITVLIILPWLTVRRVPVRISAPSGHASIIKFQGGVKAGLLGRISPSPMSEWHAFGIISNRKTEHMILAGAVGDFTKKLVSNPPSHLWVRTVHFAGLPYLVNMYNRVLVVATGSGICVFLSFLMQPCSAEICLLWIAKGIEHNFGKEIKDAVSGFPKEKVIIHDTAVLGRPNVSEMSVKAAENWGAEVVIVTSNPEGSRDVVNSCKAKGIPAFGPIWDS